MGAKSLPLFTPTECPRYELLIRYKGQQIEIPEQALQIDKTFIASSTADRSCNISTLLTSTMKSSSNLITSHRKNSQ